MALINCPECNREISDKAEACPHCGFPISKQHVVPREENTAESASNAKGTEKKAIAIFSAIAIAIIVLIIALIAGGDTTGTKPENMSEEHYQYGKRVLDIVDQYLDDRIDVDTALNRLLYGHLGEDLPETEYSDKDRTNNLSVQLKATHLKYVLVNHSSGKATLSELTEARNALAETLNEDSR